MLIDYDGETINITSLIIWFEGCKAVRIFNNRLLERSIFNLYLLYEIKE